MHKLTRRIRHLNSPQIPDPFRQFEIEKVIQDAIDWALTKDNERLFSIMAQDNDLFIFHPDSKSTISGFDAFNILGERVWMKDAFKATDFVIKELRLRFSKLGNVVCYSCLLDDHAEWDSQPMGWDNCRWTRTLEKRGDAWVIVQMHFLFPKDD